MRQHVVAARDIHAEGFEQVRKLVEAGSLLVVQRGGGPVGEDGEEFAVSVLVVVAEPVERFQPARENVMKDGFGFCREAAFAQEPAEVPA